MAKDRNPATRTLNIDEMTVNGRRIRGVLRVVYQVLTQRRQATGPELIQAVRDAGFDVKRDAIYMAIRRAEVTDRVIERVSTKATGKRQSLIVRLADGVRVVNTRSALGLERAPQPEPADDRESPLPLPLAEWMTRIEGKLDRLLAAVEWLQARDAAAQQVADAQAQNTDGVAVHELRQSRSKRPRK